MSCESILRRLRIGVAGLLACALVTAPVLAGEASAIQNAAESKHAIESGRTLYSAAAPLGKLVPLIIREDRLALDREEWLEAGEGELGRLSARQELTKQLGAACAALPPEMLDGMAREMLREHGITLCPHRLFQELVEALGADPGSIISEKDKDSGLGIALKWSNAEFQASLKSNPTEFELKVSQHGSAKSLLEIKSKVKGELLILCETPPPGPSFNFKQSETGKVVLTLAPNTPDQREIKAYDLIELIKKNVPEAQKSFLRPLSDLGIRPELHPYLPTVIAAAVSGFGLSSPELSLKVNELLSQLKSDEQTQREPAVQELIKLYPQTTYLINQALQDTQEPGVKIGLQRVVAAHPGISRAIPYVQKFGLQSDREYLISILREVPFFKSAARARLTQVVGIDCGDDPAAWPRAPKNQPPQ